MSHHLDLNSSHFWKGFFYWFGAERNPFGAEVQKSMSMEPHELIKKDLVNVKRNYRKSYLELKKEVLELG